MYDYDLEQFEDQEYYDPCDHCCECESEYGCSECNPLDLPTYS